MRPCLAIAVLLLAIPALAQNQGLVLQNGTSAYVDVPFAPSLVPTGGVTVEAWVTYDGSTLGTGWRYPTVLRMDPSPNQASYFLRVEAGQTRANRLLWWVSTSNGNYSIGWNFTAGALTTWTHVAATYDGALLRLIVNGAQVAQGTATGAIQNRGGVCRIGSGDLSVVGGETWNGEIDEVRVWPFARTAAAIQSSMSAGLAAMPGEVSTWNLDGNCLDSSGANHGTAIGSPGFAANTLVLTPVPFPGALGFGAASGCRSNGLAAITALPTVGNAAFGVCGTRAPANQGGFLLLSMASLPSPVQVQGATLYVDIGRGITLFLVANALGTAQAGLAIPGNSGLAGVGFDAQFAWLDGSCGNGISASGALAFGILP